jgi:hypothetical protein
MTERQEQRQALRDMHGAFAEAKNGIREAFDEDTGFSAEKGAAAAQRLQEELAKASQNLSGDDAKIAQATRTWLAAFQAKGAAYNQLLKEIEIETLLNLRGVDRGTLGIRRKNVERMLAGNAELSQTIRDAEQDFESELVKLNVSPKMRSEVLIGYRTGARRKHELLLKVRATDQTLGEASLQLFDLMDREWGKWTYDDDADLVRFESNESVETYKELMNRIQQASQEQLDVQRALVQ